MPCLLEKKIINETRRVFKKTIFTYCQQPHIFGYGNRPAISTYHLYSIEHSL
jgi:hypothetical protein